VKQPDGSTSVKGFLEDIKIVGLDVKKGNLDSKTKKKVDRLLI
jgi:hypothetical protein